MRAFITSFIFLAAVGVAYPINNSSSSTDGTAALQVLSILDQLEDFVLEELVARTNDTKFLRAYEKEASLRAIDYILEPGGAYFAPQCNYSLPNSTSSLVDLEQIIQVVRAGTLLAWLQRLNDAGSSLLSTLGVMAIIQSLQGNLPEPVTSHVPELVPFITPITPQWAFNLLDPFIVAESCTSPTKSTPGLELTSQNGTTVNLAWGPVPVESYNGTLFVGWASLLQEPLYTPLTLTSQNSGTTSMPSSLLGLVAAVLTDKMPENIYDLTASTLSGPVLAEIVF